MPEDLVVGASRSYAPVGRPVLGRKQGLGGCPSSYDNVEEHFCRIVVAQLRPSHCVLSLGLAFLLLLEPLEPLLQRLSVVAAFRSLLRRGRRAVLESSLDSFQPLETAGCREPPRV